MNSQQKIAIGIVDVAVLAELCLSLYISNKDIDNFTPLFFKYFFSMLVPTLILAKVFIKRLGSGESI
ncbi:MAG: hypothetical protein ABFD97_17885 [Syntrophobacter sp.]